MKALLIIGIIAGIILTCIVVAFLLALLEVKVIKKKLRTPKDVFIYIRDDKTLLYMESHICYCIDELRYSGRISKSLAKQSEAVLKENKPNNDEFTEHKYWNGNAYWWNVAKACRNGERDLVLKEKRRFLTHLINKL